MSFDMYANITIDIGEEVNQEQCKTSFIFVSIEWLSQHLLHHSKKHVQECVLVGVYSTHIVDRLYMHTRDIAEWNIFKVLE